MSSIVEDNQDISFEKYQDSKRWLNKEHHKGKDSLHKQLKDTLFIEKIIDGSNTEHISKRKTKQILNDCKDDLNPNIYYSLNKKNRWINTAPIDLLKSVPSTCQGEVVHKNILGSNRGSINDVFSVHSKTNIDENDPENFEIRNAESSSAKGQHISNFLPESRELSKKKKGKECLDEKKEKEGKKGSEKVTYNLYRVSRNGNIVGTQMFKSNQIGDKSQLKGRSKPILYEDDYECDDLSDYSDEDEEDQESTQPLSQFVNLSDHLIDNFKMVKHYPKNQTTDYKEFETSDPISTFVNSNVVHQILEEKEYTFTQFTMKSILDVNKKNNWHTQVRKLCEEEQLTVTVISENEILVDASKWCHNKNPFGEHTLFINCTNIPDRKMIVRVNSTICERKFEVESLQSSQNLVEFIKILTKCYTVELQNIAENKMSSSFFKNGLMENMNIQRYYYDFKKDLMNLNYPERLVNERQFNCYETIKKGIIQDWKHICETVREVHNSTNADVFIDSKQTFCSYCNAEQLSIHLLMSNNSLICRSCLINQFEKQLELKQFPIDLKITTTENVNYFDLLPAIIPLPVLNYYIRMVFQSIYCDLGASGIFDTCPNCRSTLYFDDSSDLCDICCECDYTWCIKCKTEPHWPMNCQQYQIWTSKWNLRYDLHLAQGSGNDKLYRIFCNCKNGMVLLRGPLEHAECSNCGDKIRFNREKNEFENQSKSFYWPYTPRFRDKYHDKKKYWSWYTPKAAGSVSISSIEDINKSVVTICAEARSIRFDRKSRREIRKKKEFENIEEGIINQMSSSICYLVENVTAWMYISNNFDRKIQKKLRVFMDKREHLILDCKENEIEPALENLKSLIEEVLSDVKSQSV